MSRIKFAQFHSDLLRGRKIRLPGDKVVKLQVRLWYFRNGFFFSIAIWIDARGKHVLHRGKINQDMYSWKYFKTVVWSDYAGYVLHNFRIILDVCDEFRSHCFAYSLRFIYYATNQETLRKSRDSVLSIINKHKFKPYLVSMM